MLQNIASDNEGAVETCSFTVQDDPVYYVDGIQRDCVPNIPSLYANASSILPSSATLPFDTDKLQGKKLPTCMVTSMSVDSVVENF